MQGIVDEDAQRVVFLLNNQILNLMNILEKALMSKNCIFSVMGPHASEGVGDILSRKKLDVVNCGETFWIARFCQEDISLMDVNADAYIVLIESKCGAKNTKAGCAAKYFSTDKKVWLPINKSLSPVTGRTKGSGAHAFWVEGVEFVEGENIDLKQYVYANGGVISNKIGHSTALVRPATIKTDKSDVRKVIAVLKLKQPFNVWVRQKKNC